MKKSKIIYTLFLLILLIIVSLMEMEMYFGILNGDYAGDIEFLENGHFYISDPNQGINGVKINYSSFIEIDYLGKIYKQWITEYGVHHELVPLSHHQMMVLGTNEESNFLDSYIYLMDLDTGKMIKQIDLYALLHKIDPDLIERLPVPFDLVNNSADYQEETGELLISLRGLNSLMKLDFHTSEIKWIFGDPDFWGEKFKTYMLKIKDNTRFLGGQHSAFVTADGLIGVHNNDMDQFDLSNTNLAYYQNRYTTCDLYQVDEQNKTIETVWQYTDNKEQFSNVAGHIEMLEDGNKLITYGWAMKREAYANPEEVLYTDPSYKHGVILQINQKDESIFKVTMPGLIYRTFLIKGFYQDKTKNYQVEEFKRFNGTNVNGQEIQTAEIKKELQGAKKFLSKIEIKTNRVYIQEQLSEQDIVNILLIGEDNKSYVYTYKQAGKEAPKSFNSGYSSIKVNAPEGKYHIYININGAYYDTEKIVEF